MSATGLAFGCGPDRWTVSATPMLRPQPLRRSPAWRLWKCSRPAMITWWNSMKPKPTPSCRHTRACASRAIVPFCIFELMHLKLLVFIAFALGWLITNIWSAFFIRIGQWRRSSVGAKQSREHGLDWNERHFVGNDTRIDDIFVYGDRVFRCSCQLGAIEVHVVQSEVLAAIETKKIWLLLWFFWFIKSVTHV